MQLQEKKYIPIEKTYHYHSQHRTVIRAQ